MNRSNQLFFIALSLKVTGIILILCAVLDYLLFLTLPTADDSGKLLVMGQIIDTGLTPIIGLGFILASYWLETKDQSQSSKFLTLKFWSLVISGILGVIFLTLIPFYLTDLNQVKSDEITKIEQNQNLGDAQIQLQNQYQTLNQLATVFQNQAQLKQLIQQIDTELPKINQALSSGKYNGKTLNNQEIQQLQAQRTQLETIKTFKDNPQNLDNQIKEIKNKIETEKSNRTKETNDKYFKQGLRISLRSLFLAVGYIAIAVFAWLSFK